MKSVSSRKDILQKFQNHFEFVCVEAKSQEALLAPYNSKLAQRLADVQKHVATICRFCQNIVPSCLLITS